MVVFASTIRAIEARSQGSGAAQEFGGDVEVGLNSGFPAGGDTVVHSSACGWCTSFQGDGGSCALFLDGAKTMRSLRCRVATTLRRRDNLNALSGFSNRRRARVWRGALRGEKVKQPKDQTILLGCGTNEGTRWIRRNAFVGCIIWIKS
jgi:hypothetical protein